MPRGGFELVAEPVLGWAIGAGWRGRDPVARPLFAHLEGVATLLRAGDPLFLGLFLPTQLPPELLDRPRWTMDELERLGKGALEREGGQDGEGI